jgi:outer membrane protein OmpA-like peptidoglycan-associated protein
MMPVRITLLPHVASLACAVSLAAIGLPMGSLAADPPAQETSAVLSGEQIELALHPPATTRSFPSRGLSRRDTAAHEQSVNLNVPFDLNSSTLTPQASAQLAQLEIALNSASLSKDRFMVGGHTDAKGSAQYNKQLSLRRAEAVKSYLVSKGIDGKRLDAVGYGSEHPLAPERPEDPSNRRVEIKDLGEAQD